MQAAGFPGAVGVVDGSLIPLKSRPRNNPWSYWSRKKSYALAMQAVVDFQGRFISFDIGWPGSTNDTTMWKMSHIWRQRHLYFNIDEWIMADKGYPISAYTIRLFAEYDITGDAGVAETRTQWNLAFSSKRVVVEHAFGQLKSRFPSLQAFPGWKLKSMYREIEALLILHNICLAWRDLVETGDGFNEAPPSLPQQGNHANAGDQANVRACGLVRRKQLVEYWDTHIHRD
ncbi:hypothetical protein ACGC1H_005763 [Rhizoctonia solani]